MADGHYERLREQYRPCRLRVLLIGESPPDPNQGEARFFYAPDLTQYDNLYRGVAEAVYGTDPEYDPSDKQRVLERLSRDGFWLIDAVSEPINRLPRSERRARIVAAAPGLVSRCMELKPQRGVIICHTVVFESVADLLAKSGVSVLHATPLPFPLGNWRRQFVEGVRAALRNKPAP